MRLRRAGRVSADRLEEYGDKTGALKLYRRALEVDPQLGLARDPNGEIASSSFAPSVAYGSMHVSSKTSVTMRGNRRAADAVIAAAPK